MSDVPYPWLDDAVLLLSLLCMVVAWAGVFRDLTPSKIRNRWLRTVAWPPYLLVVAWGGPLLLLSFPIWWPVLWVVQRIRRRGQRTSG